MKQIVLSDFDGTIIVEDSALHILELYGVGDWRKYDEQLSNDEISLEECLSKQFSSINKTPEEILNAVTDSFMFRSNFRNFVMYCESLQIPLVIVSAGLDFVINHFLTKVNMNNHIPVISGITKFDSNQYSFNFPALKYTESKNFKEDQVIYYQEQGYNVIYIGDGSGDFYAVKRADITYVVKESELSRMCRQNEVKYHSFLDFQTIILALNSS
ncbi:MAG: MtnX-like HAD-IB family phosphatase [Candidatus Hodarchaeales archaeon]|jgi:2,3-diketo-5-methylthio-1-phosphopentane phosphatase